MELGFRVQGLRFSDWGLGFRCSAGVDAYDVFLGFRV